MRTYASSRVKRKTFYRKSDLQMFLLVSCTKSVNKYVVSIQSSVMVREMFRQITQKLWATLLKRKLFALVQRRRKICRHRQPFLE